MPHAAARLARVWGETDATKSLEFGSERLEIVGTEEEEEEVVVVSSVSAGAESRTESTSLWLWRLTRTASAEVTQPEQARQSVKDICAGALAAPLEREDEEGCPSRMTSNSRDSGCGGGAVAGRVSIGLMQATPGLMKSLRSSAERMADIFFGGRGLTGAVLRCGKKRWRGGRRLLVEDISM